MISQSHYAPRPLLTQPFGAQEGLCRFLGNRKNNGIDYLEMSILYLSPSYHFTH